MGGIPCDRRNHAAERILANDFVGVSPEGALYDKPKIGSATRTAPRVLLQITCQSPGSAAILLSHKAMNPGEKCKGESRRSRFVCTDTTIRRNGQSSLAKIRAWPEPTIKIKSPHTGLTIHSFDNTSGIL